MYTSCLMISKLYLKAKFSSYRCIVQFNYWSCWTKKKSVKWSTVHRCNKIKCGNRKEAAVFKILPTNSDLKPMWLKFLNRKHLPVIDYVFVREHHFEESTKQRKCPLNEVANVIELNHCYISRVSEWRNALSSNKLNTITEGTNEKIFRPDEINSTAFKNSEVKDYSPLNENALWCIDKDHLYSTNEYIYIVFCSM